MLCVRSFERAAGREVRVGGLARGKVTFRRSRYAFWQTGFFNRFRLSYRSHAIGQPPESPAAFGPVRGKLEYRAR
jgi:hypothetical protein